jgi:hypothetical protein
MIRIPARQRGIVLILSLIMLMALTLIAVSAIRLSTANLRTVANSQARTEAMSTAQRTIDQILSTNFTDNIAGTAQTLTVTEGGKNYTVAVARPCRWACSRQECRLNIALADDAKCLDTLQPLLGLRRHHLADPGDLQLGLVRRQHLDYPGHRYPHGQRCRHGLCQDTYRCTGT